MLDKLIHYEDLSPFLPLNETLSAMTDSEFSTMMDKWTESAKSAPFVREVHVGEFEDSEQNFS